MRVGEVGVLVDDALRLGLVVLLGFRLPPVLNFSYKERYTFPGIGDSQIALQNLSFVYR